MLKIIILIVWVKKFEALQSSFTKFEAKLEEGLNSIQDHHTAGLNKKFLTLHKSLERIENQLEADFKHVHEGIHHLNH